MIRTQMGMHDRSEMVAVQGSLCGARPVIVTVTINCKILEMGQIFKINITTCRAYLHK
jgi:hypothetical protein